MGVHARVAARKPPLTPQQKQKRLEYAHQNLHRDWSNVIFSDEKTFKSDECAKEIVYRGINTRFDERHLQPKKRSGRICAGLWGWMSIDGPGEFSMITRRFNSEDYVEILEENFVPTVNICYGGLANVIFMQDNSSIHRSKYTTQWFNAHPKLRLIDALVNSPDLNPIENMWWEMVRGWEIIYPRNRARLESYICERWESLRYRPEYFRNLYSSMPRRMQEVIDRNGAMTKF
ncbi:Transposable element Tcb1 transposase, partial [Pseudolycoriella hygida]